MLLHDVLKRDGCAGEGRVCCSGKGCVVMGCCSCAVVGNTFEDAECAVVGRDGL